MPRLVVSILLSFIIDDHLFMQILFIILFHDFWIFINNDLRFVQEPTHSWIAFIFGHFDAAADNISLHESRFRTETLCA